MAIADLRDPDEKLIETVNAGNTVKCDLVALNSRGKERIRFFMDAVLSRFEAAEYAEDLFLSVMELCFNAVKANYGCVLVLDRIRSLLHYKADQIDMEAVWNSQYMLTMYRNFVDASATKDQVKQIIRGESQVFRITEKAASEGRAISAEEEAEIGSCLGMMNRTIRDKVRATLSIARVGKKIIIDVINDAPITEQGLLRIEEKRRIFRSYYERDMIGEFYMENLDETESAGFGAAMIDSRLLGWGLDPWQHFKVLSLNRKTCASLTVEFGGGK